MNLRASMQRGFALISALFLLIVLAALGVYMVSISSTEHYTALYAIQSAKAYYAARSGIEWGTTEATTNGCAAADTGGTPLTPGGALSGFSVIVSCTNPNTIGTGQYSESQLTNSYNVYAITATAYTTNIAFGNPGYASRRIRVTITTATAN